MKIIDLHCDTILECYRNPAYPLSSNCGHISTDKLLNGNALAQFFAIFISPKEKQFMTPYDIFNEIYETYQAQLALNTDYIKPAFCAQDILSNAAEMKISSILSVEDGVILEGQIERIQEVFEKGVRLITLTWNFENHIGYPCSDHLVEHHLGLKPFGIEAVAEMNRLGILVDVSHLSEGGFYDVAAHSKKPFVASHSCARALCDHRRNLTDDQLKVLGKQGGLVGVNFAADFLKENSTQTTIAQIVKHIRYMVNKAGIESVGLGSDFDGIDCALELQDYASYPRLLEALSRYFSGRQLELICSGNALRVIRENVGS